METASHKSYLKILSFALLICFSGTSIEDHLDSNGIKWNTKPFMLDDPFPLILTNTHPYPTQALEKAMIASMASLNTPTHSHS